MTPSPGFPPAPQGPDLPTSPLNAMPTQGAQAPPEANPILGLLQSLQQVEPQAADQGLPPAITDPISRTEIGKHIQDALAQQQAIQAQLQQKLAAMQQNTPEVQLQKAAQSHQDNLEKHRADLIKQQHDKYGTAGTFLINLLRAPGQPTLEGAAKAVADQDFQNSMKEAQSQIAAQHLQDQDQIKALQNAAQQNNPIALAAQKAELERQERVDILKKYDLTTPEGRAAASLIISGQVRPDPSLAYHSIPGNTSAAQIKQAYGVEVPEGEYRVAMIAGQRVFTPVIGKTSTSWVQTPSGIQEVKTNELGLPTGTVAGAINPALLFKEGTNETKVTVQGPTGPQIQTTNLSHSSGPVLPPMPGGGPPAPASQGGGLPSGTVPRGERILGNVPLSPLQTQTLQSKLGALQNTRELIAKVQGNLPVLNSMISAGKIQLSTDPKTGDVHLIKTALSRMLPMTKQETDLAGDMESLTEHINTVRGPLGAAGFKGPEAFGALQQQRGSLLQNPDITKRVLDSTLRAIDTQIAPLKSALGQKAPPEVRKPLSDIFK